MAEDSRIELRCFCSRSPLLAIAGRDADGAPFIHTKVHKGKKLYAEIVATAGLVRLRCRECLRWHLVTIKREVKQEVSALPESIEVG